jgi:hypothetical protein
MCSCANRKERKHYVKERKKSRKKELPYETTIERIRRKRTIFSASKNDEKKKKERREVLRSTVEAT